MDKHMTTEKTRIGALTFDRAYPTAETATFRN